MEVEEGGKKKAEREGPRQRKDDLSDRHPAVLLEKDSGNSSGDRPLDLKTPTVSSEPTSQASAIVGLKVLRCDGGKLRHRTCAEGRAEHNYESCNQGARPEPAAAQHDWSVHQVQADQKGGKMIKVVMALGHEGIRCCGCRESHIRAPGAPGQLGGPEVKRPSGYL